MDKQELCKIIRKYYKEALSEQIKWEKKYEEEKHKKYVKDYYWASSREWVLHELAEELGVELFDDDFKLIGEEA